MQQNMRLTSRKAKERDKTAMPDFEESWVIEKSQYVVNQDDFTVKRLTRKLKKPARKIKFDINFEIKG